MRPLFPQADIRMQAVLEPRRFIRWVYVGRLSIAASIFVAAVVKWLVVDSEQTLIATLSFVGALFFTAASFLWTQVRRKPLTDGFLYGQFVVDLLVVTAVVHVTSLPTQGSQFAALYILVNAAAALFLPIGGALLITLLGSVIYVTDSLYVSDVTAATLLQLGVFSAVAVSTGYISARLREAGMGRELLAAELVHVRLREADILANIKSGIISVDDAGDLLFANPSASELLGVSLEARIGRPVIGDIGEIAPWLGEALERAVRERVHASRAEGFVVRGGRTFPLGVTTTSFDGSGDRGRTTTAIFQDISDQKRLELLNLRMQRLEAVTELSASLAHEIKNPLASIRSAVEQLSTRPAASDDERTLGKLIVRESDRLSRLLSEFLDFARVRVTRREPVDVGPVLRGAAGLAGQHPARLEKPHTVKLDVDVPSTPLFVHGDEDLLHRAVFNLALNALQAALPGTSVRLIARAATADEVPRGVAFADGAVAIEVIDEGPGIPQTVQDRMFEPFTTTKAGGSGLGLAIAHRAIEAHGGVVLVDTSERGTRFTVLLPRAQTRGVRP